MRIAILGAGGHGRDLAAIAKALGHQVEMFDDSKPGHWGCHKVDGPYMIGVNDPATRRRIEAAVDDELVPFDLIHPTATYDPYLSVIQFGVAVGAGTHIGPGCYLGDHVHVGPGCTLTRTTVGDYTTISPGVNIAGDVTIGAGVLVGVGAVVSNLVTIGDNAVIGAGAVVVRDVAPGETVICRELTATRGNT